jgi:ribosomal protein L11 methyltransferase
MSELRRVSVSVPRERAEPARARMIELFPHGFEEVESTGSIELVGYTDAAGEERFLHEFSGAQATDVEAGWEDRWRAFHRPVRVGPLWVGPPWEEPDEDAVPVVIDPGRAFGTGSHPTTRLCLEHLVEVAERGRSLLDVGCGSGVLGIAAAALGFQPVVALDEDRAAIEAARENALRNRVALDVRLANALEDDLPEADVTVANISLEVVLALGPRLQSPLVVTAGYLVSELPQLVGYERIARRESDAWAADLYERSAATS